MKLHRILALVLAIAMVLCFAACGTGASGSKPASGSAAASSGEPAAPVPTDAPPPADAPEDKPSDEPAEPASVYPIVGDDLSLTIWGSFNSPAGNYVETYADFPAMQLACEKMGIEVEWLCFSPPAANENFPISIATGDMPDIYRNFMQLYGASGQQAADENVIIQLNDLLDEYCPNYMEVINGDESLYRDCVDDSGKIWAFWAISNQYIAQEGLSLRQDWLDALKMEVPSDLESIEAYLEGIKTEYGCVAPYFLTSAYGGDSSPFTHCFNVGGINERSANDQFFQIDGKVHCSYIEDGYREYLALMNKWFNAGYISSDFVSTHEDMRGGENVTKIGTNETGLFMVMGQTYPDYKAAAVDASFALTAIGNFNTNGDDTTHLTPVTRRHGRNCWAITTACENPDVAAKFFDFWYTEEGIELVNYGEKDYTWTEVDGKPTFTEVVTKNTEGLDLSVTQLANYYCLYNEVCGFFDETRLFQFYEEDVTSALSVWTQSRDNLYLVPSGISLTPQETETYNAAMQDIRTYVLENIGKFISGDRALSEWEAYVEEIKGMGVQDCIDIYQAAFERYMAR